MTKQILSIILGGGVGSRLFPLTKERSKPAVPLGGKYRLVDITVSNCINSGLHYIYVLTQFNSASLNRHIARTYRFSRFSDGFVEILAAEQTPENKNWFQGTADAVRQIMVHVRDFDPSHVLILSGDHLYQMDYRKFINHHLEKNADSGRLRARLQFRSAQDRRRGPDRRVQRKAARRPVGRDARGHDKTRVEP
jgi:glucose-1-phosphate adenylyltransferase